MTRRPEMDEALATALADAGVAALGIGLADGHRPGTIRYVALAARIAGPLLDHDIAMTAEPAPVFAADDSRG